MVRLAEEVGKIKKPNYPMTDPDFEIPKRRRTERAKCKKNACTRIEVTRIEEEIFLASYSYGATAVDSHLSSLEKGGAQRYFLMSRRMADKYAKQRALQRL